MGIRSLREPTTIKIRLHQISLSRKVQPARVMLTGDWHISPIITERQAEFLGETLEQVTPDLIILQGDLVDSPQELKRETSVKKLERQLRLCAEKAQTVLVLGMHDFVTPNEPRIVMKDFAIPFWKDLCQKCGVKLLLNEWLELENLRIFGAFQDEKCSLASDDPSVFKDNPEEFEKFIEKLDFSDAQPDKINWFAAHAPLLTEKVVGKCTVFDVMSFGHTHGGIVPRGMDEIFDKLGLHFGLISPDLKPFPKKVRGAWEEQDKTFVVINSGMTGAQFCAPRLAQKMNFIKAAEVSLIEVSGGEDNRD